MCGAAALFLALPPAAKSGVLACGLGPPAYQPPPPAAGVSGAAGGPSSLFMGLIQSVLDNVRWTPDPWAAITGRDNSQHSQLTIHSLQLTTHNMAQTGHLKKRPATGVLLFAFTLCTDCWQ